MNDEILKKLGYNSIALEMLLKREAQINPEDILMPGERPSINKDPSLNDLSSDVESDVRNIINKLEEVSSCAHFYSLPFLLLAALTCHVGATSLATPRFLPVCLSVPRQTC